MARGARGLRPVSALLRLGIAEGRRSSNSEVRTAAYLGALSEVTTHVEPELARAVAWMIRHLVSSDTWLALYERGGISSHHSGAAVAWAIETLLEALRSGRGPATATYDAPARKAWSDGRRRNDR